MIRDAILSACGTYRYLLTREWEPKAKGATVIMLNPSTADAEKDDATIRSLCRILSAKGYGSFLVANLFAFRATKPGALKDAADPIGPRNNTVLRNTIACSKDVICAWGTAKFARERAASVLRMIEVEGRQPMCFGLTDGGFPRHPLYVRTNAVLEKF